MTHIVGIDEAGRGALAGPVSVGAVKMSIDYYPKWLQGIKDSKMLSPKKREEWLQTLERDTNIEQVYALIDNNHIDTKGIVSAVREGIDRVLKELALDSNKTLVVLDGGIYAPEKFVHQETIIKGDEKVAVIGLASIVAKVMRDRYMCALEKETIYHFSTHKGYGTKLHKEAIKKHGLSNQHRKTFCH